MNDKFLTGIGSYWPQFFKDRDVLESFGTASTEMLSSVYMELSNLVLSLSHEDVPVYDRLKWDLLVLNASDTEVVDGKYRFPLPAAFNTKGMNRSSVMLSSAVSPKVTLNQGYDFTIGDRFIEFNVDPFSVSGIPIREVGGDLQIMLWCPIADIDTNRIWRNYGHFIKRWKFSTPAYKNFVRGMFHTRVFGPILNRMESGLHLLSGLPVAGDRNEIVLAIIDNGDFSVVRTSLRDYTIPPGANVRVSAGDTLSPFQALTDIITVVDYLAEPAWWRGRIGELPADIGVTIDVDKAFDQYLKYNTFLIRINYITFLDALSRDGGNSALFEKKKVYTYKKISQTAQFKLDGSYRLGVIVSESLLGYVSGSSNIAGFMQEFKPSYTYAIILFYLAFNIPVPSWLVYSLLFRKDINQPYPWDVNRLDGSWKLGISDRLLRLGEFALNNSTWGRHTLPETVRGFAYRQLYNGKITVSTLLRKFIENGEYIYAQLGESKLKVGCGGWKVGKNKILTISDAYFQKQISIDTPPVYDTGVHSYYPLWYPVSPVQITGMNKLSNLKRLDGSWGVGAPVLPLRLGDFKVVRERSILSESFREIKKESYFGILKKLTTIIKLGIYDTLKLDGTWHVGAYHKVDGRWKLRQGSRLAAPRFSYSVLKIDGDWKLGETRRDVRLNGSWRLSEGQGAYADIIINRVAA